MRELTIEDKEFYYKLIQWKKPTMEKNKLLYLNLKEIAQTEFWISIEEFLKKVLMFQYWWEEIRSKFMKKCNWDLFIYRNMRNLYEIKSLERKYNKETGRSLLKDCLWDQLEKPVKEIVNWSKKKLLKYIEENYSSYRFFAQSSLMRKLRGKYNKEEMEELRNEIKKRLE